MAANGWFWRIPAWVYIGLLAVCLVLSLAAGLRGHTSSAIWFAILAALNVWTLSRRRAVHRPPSQPYDLAQMRRKVLVWPLALIGFGLATEAGTIVLAAGSSGADRFGWSLMAVIMLGVLVSLIRKTVIFVRDLADDNMLIGQEDDPDPGDPSADHQQ